MARAGAMCAVLVIVVVVVGVPSAVAARVMGPAMAPSAAAAWAMAPAGASTAEQQCDVEKLLVCGPAIIGGTAPSASCCSNLKAQEHCFCQYAKDPDYSHYIDTPNARKTLAACGITLPTCSK